MQEKSITSFMSGGSWPRARKTMKIKSPINLPVPFFSLFLPNFSPHYHFSFVQSYFPEQMSSTVLPVCMPPPEPTYAGKTATVTGWGDTSSHGTASVFLQEVDVKVSLFSLFHLDNVGFLREFEG